MDHKPVPSAEKALQLPSMVISPIDVARLSRELEALEDFLQQANIRNPGTPVRLPRMSHMFEELGAQNGLNWLQEVDRKRGVAFLRQLKDHAPVVHISFAADPSAAFMGKLVMWFRSDIHPQTLIRIGLQPTIAAGCVVRTTNHTFDFSLRQRFMNNRQLLLAKLRGENPAA